MSRQTIYRTRRRMGLASLSLLALLALRAGAETLSPPPVAPPRPVTDTYFGTAVVDPYQWMENLTNPEVVSWFKGQDNYTRNVLSEISGRHTLLARIKELDSAGYGVSDVQLGGSRVFYFKTAPKDNNRKLYVREGFSGPERLLVDPETLTVNGVHSSIDYYAASWDGKSVAYAVSPGGSENSVIHVLDVASGKNGSEQIDRAQFGDLAWRPDNRSFFYNRLQKLSASSAPTDRYKRSRIYLHFVGKDPAGDQPVFGAGLAPRLTMAESDIPIVVVTPGSRWAFGLVARGVQNEIEVYAAPLASVRGSATPWRKVAGFGDDITQTDIHGDDLYLLSHHNASRFKIVRVNAAHPDLAHAFVVVPAGSAVIVGLGVARDGLYVRDLDGGIGRLRRVPFAGGSTQRLPLPYEGAVPFLVTYADRPGALFLETGWTRSALWYAYNPAAGTVADTRLKPLSPVDFSAITSREVKAKAADGTMIPLSIVCARDLTLDGSHPTLLEGYGAYGITLNPGFSPTTLAWLERGGVLAYAHVRGGGEYGEDWHHAGMGLTKPNTWNDLIACAQYLIDQHYTMSAHLACQGGSAGGITVGRALTERPDLFAAVIDSVGVSDALRSELSPNGPPNIPEYGTFKTPDGFRALYAMDAYLHVRDGVAYPAVLLTTGINDPRVPSWEPAKMAARLQAATSSGKPILLRVDYDAGHGMGSTKTQFDLEEADEYAFLLWQFGVPGFQVIER